MLDASDVPAPRLLAQIQGLIPAEPIISSGQLREDEPPESPEEGSTGPAVVALAATPIAEDTPDAGEPAPTTGPEEKAETTEEPPEHAEPTPPAEQDQPERGRHPVWIPAFEDEPEQGIEVEAPVTQEETVTSSALVLVEPAPLVARRHFENPWLLGLIALVLISAILLASLFSPDESAPAPRRPAVESTYTYIELLPNRPRVLLAWDYEPTTQGEMQLLAQPVVSHLRLKRARIANVSLRPTGPAVAADTIALVDSQLPLDAAATQPPVVEIGFIPGDAAALRALSQAPAETGNLSELSAQDGGLDADETLEAFDLIIEFSAETAASREWIEQIASRLDTPMIIAASGAVAPTLRPYEQTGQIAALLSGYPDALAYEQILGQDGPASKQQSAQTWLSLLLVALVITLIIRSARKPRD